MLIAFAVLTVTGSRAQYLNDSPFEEGTTFVGVSASGFDLNYYKSQKWRLAVAAKAGYFFADDWMLAGNLGYDNSTYGRSSFQIGAGVRYSIEQNGLNIGAGVNFVHSAGIDDLKPRVSLGYTYFLGRHLAVEPELYFDISTKSSDYTGFGLAIGAGYYF